MSASTVQQLTDAEAEAVLVALGPKLEWKGESPGWYSQYLNETSVRRYSIVRPHEHTGLEKPFTAFVTQVDGQSWSSKHANLEEAKAACERHYATGKWN